MFCSGCGKKNENPEANVPCECGYTPPPAVQNPGPGVTGADIANALKARFSFNQLVIYGGCVLLFICLFLPFASISGWGGTHRQLGYGMAFDTFGGFYDLMIPLLAMAVFSALSALSILKAESAKLLFLVFSLLGVYVSLSVLISLGALGAIGVGAVFFFIIWLVVFAAAVLEYKGIQLIKF